MSYTTKRLELLRTPQDILTLGVRECGNHYASLVPQLMTYTEEIDNAAWTKTSVTVTANNATAPDGTLTADTCVFNADNDAIHQEAAVVVTSKAFTQSIWLRVPSGSATISLRIRNTSNSEGTQQSMTVTTTWTRFWLHRLFTGTPVDNVHSRLVRLPGDTINGDIEVWGWNLHQNPSNLDRVIKFPYVKRVAEASGEVAVNASRCEASDKGDGARCFYSGPTCQDMDNFNVGHPWELDVSLRAIREYKLCNKDAPLPLQAENILPVIVGRSTASQEIDFERSVTINERITFNLADSPSPLVWNARQQADGGLVNTSTAQLGRFWARWAEIYRNYSNPDCYARLSSGFVESMGAESEYQQRGNYLMTNFQIDDRTFTLTCADRLRLTRKTIPAQISDDNVLREKIDSSATTIFLADVTEISEPGDGYTVVLELDPDGTTPEKTNLVSINDTDRSVVVTRGRWGTTAIKHGKVNFRELREYGTERTTPSDAPLGKNPVDIILELYRDAGIAEADIDRTALQAARDMWMPSTLDATAGTHYGPLLRRTVSEPTDVEQLSQEIRDLTMLLLWVSSAQKLTGRFFAPRDWNESVTDITDEADILAGTVSINQQDEARITTVLLAWSPITAGSGESPQDFRRVRIYLSLKEVGTPMFGQARIRSLLSEWLTINDTATAEYFISHVASRFSYGARQLTFRLEVKDDDLQVGSRVAVSTNLLQDSFGNRAERDMFISKKTMTDTGEFEVELIDAPLYRYGYWGDTPIIQYPAATTAERQQVFWADDEGNVSGDPGYRWW